MKVSIFYNTDNKDAGLYAQKAKNILESFKARVFLFDGNHDLNSIERLICDCNVVVAIGGDGTIMRYSKFACKYDKPILGINSGRLGFLAGLEKSEIRKLKDLVDKNYKIVERMLIKVRVIGQNQDIVALNDIVVSRGSDSQIIDFKVTKSDKIICEFRSDGVVTATPTGSTAYSLSAGGPIVEAQMKCILLTPVCPHSLSVRPLIFDSKGELKIEFKIRKGSEAVIMADGERVCKLTESGYIVIKHYEKKVRMITMSDLDFYKNINMKLIGKDLCKF